ncbi:hypothetical protein [Larsenimonas suaedae]|uniref:Uncharacterized protein n=1 Tax=Larsenimonas suaedae TaxID=1851019 RepID=A0ABU1H1C7_9GAMM|nr:hypothetical protein [Larsenimonas suaedae]MCM2973481.1 hypothetical protein [Larsenimonas suaedae]MDR5897343.1 hypothetical protein [Larsenimonas suaedae]
MKLWKKWRERLEKAYWEAKAESEYKIPYRIVGNGVLVADAKDIVNSGAYKEQIRKAAELERRTRGNNC